MQQPYIRKIQFKNYKSIRNLTIECHAGLNIIIGPNGSGKTNFVTALHHLLTKSSFFEFPMGFEFDLFLHTTQETLHWVGQVAEKRLRKSTTKVKTYQSVLSAGLKSLENAHWSDNLMDFLEEYQLADWMSGSQWIGYGVPTQLPFLNQLDVLMRTSTGEIVLGKTEALQLSYLSPSNLVFKKIKKDINLTEQFTHQLAKYSPIQNCRVSEGYTIQEKDDFLILNHIVLEFFIHNTWHPWNELSDGTKRLFYIIASTLNAHGVVVLEEPELGIHPDQLYQLMAFLKEQAQQKQIILTTHAPDVLNILNDNELHRIIITRFDLQKGTQMHHLSAAKIKEALIYMDAAGLALKDYWVHSNLEDSDETEA